jgi:large subunit ribosomal protein L10
LALTRNQKQEQIEGYAQRVSRAQVLIWAHYKGLTVAQISALRRQLRETGAEAMVVKNTLMGRALQQAGLPVEKPLMAGPCVVAFLYDDIAASTKTVLDFSRLNENVFQVAGGVVGGKLASVEELRSLVTLPSREVMLARVVGGVQAPISGFVGALAAIMRGVLNVLDARAKQLEGAAS